MIDSRDLWADAYIEWLWKHQGVNMTCVRYGHRYTMALGEDGCMSCGLKRDGTPHSLTADSLLRSHKEYQKLKLRGRFW